MFCALCNTDFFMTSCYQDGAIALFYGGGGDASWWGWIQSAKEKVVSQSSEVLEFVKKDIDEFTKVVSEEASSMVSSTATTLKEKLRLDEDDSAANTMKKSVSGFLNHVAEVFTPPPDDADQEAIVIRNQQPVILNRLQAAIYAVSQDAATYLTDPEGEESQYEAWLSTFDLESRQAELSDLLVNNQPLRHHYTTLVPAQVSHVVFWHRYFYKVNQLEAAEEKRKVLKERAEKMSTDTDLVWDEDEDFGGDVEIPEDVQAQLLEDYEKECEETSRKKSVKDTMQCDKTQCPSDKEAQTSTENNALPNQTKLNTDVELLQELKVDLSKAAETSSKPSPSSTARPSFFEAENTCCPGDLFVMHS
ncbi:BSD domain-containing protein 1-like isoform X2 [Eriocheir sinensis]|uniref:BSD domain-containing protein 1-like isoform X2 n=1 Tax=Eriocheir sinensis TaxID=95602 RepID=UPI0021C917CD|nr:BSD domain-containing protein 1-like isoform X2 [Eriocheir sinensis]